FQFQSVVREPDGISVITNPFITILNDGRKLFFFTKDYGANGREKWYKIQEYGQSTWGAEIRIGESEFPRPGMIDGAQNALQVGNEVWLALYSREDGSPAFRKIIMYRSVDNGDSFEYQLDVTDQLIERVEPGLLRRHDN